MIQSDSPKYRALKPIEISAGGGRKRPNRRRLLPIGLSVAMFFGAIAAPSLSPSAEASCNGCTAHWSIQVQSGGQSGIRWNQSSETLVTQDFHGSLIDGCDYGGTQLFNMNHVYDYTASTPVWGTPQFAKTKLTWAGGHHWNDGVTDYYVAVADTQYGC